MTPPGDLKPRWTHDSVRLVPRSLNAAGTGSRRWDHIRSVYQVLDYVAEFALVALPASFVVLHGDNRRGADAIVRSWAVRRSANSPIGHRPFPADWSAPCLPECDPGHRSRRDDGSTWCPLAGHYRNQQIIDERPDLCLAFLRDGSGGTKDCIGRARRARIPVFVLPWEHRLSAASYAAAEFDLSFLKGDGTLW